jgi:hypothetical protein
MFHFRLFRRKPRQARPPPVTLPPTLHRENRISTLSNATTLHPLQNDILPASLLSSFPQPPAGMNLNLPIQGQQYPHTFLPNISQTSLDTLADPLGRLPNAPNRLSTFEAFINSARQAEAQRQERERFMVRAWLAAEEERRRTAARSLSNDPWRGRFGPPSSSANVERVGLGIGMGYPPQVPVRRMERVEVQRPKTSGSGVQGVKVWLRKVTSLERLRA